MFAAYVQYLLLLHRTQLSEANDKMLAVQECYISVCKEKDMLEESIRKQEKQEALIRENEVNNNYNKCLYIIRSSLTWFLT